MRDPHRQAALGLGHHPWRKRCREPHAQHRRRLPGTSGDTPTDPHILASAISCLHTHHAEDLAAMLGLDRDGVQAAIEKWNARAA